MSTVAVLDAFSSSMHHPTNQRCLYSVRNHTTNSICSSICPSSSSEPITPPHHTTTTGLGYCGLAAANYFQNHKQWTVYGTTRTDDKSDALRLRGFNTFTYDADGYQQLVGPALLALGRSTHILTTIPPDGDLDPIIMAHTRDILEKGKSLQWAGYISSTSVYGDHKGRWVHEGSDVLAAHGKGVVRMLVETSWLALHSEYQVPVHVFRCGGIYGPGRSALDAANRRSDRTVRAGVVMPYGRDRSSRDVFVDSTADAFHNDDVDGGGAVSKGARRHAAINSTRDATAPDDDAFRRNQARRTQQAYTSRCHVYDICRILEQSMNKPRPGAVYNVVDDNPAGRREVMEYAEQLLVDEMARAVHEMPWSMEYLDTERTAISGYRDFSDGKNDTGYSTESRSDTARKLALSSLGSVDGAPLSLTPVAPPVMNSASSPDAAAQEATEQQQQSRKTRLEKSNEDARVMARLRGEKKVSNALIKKEFGIELEFPTYKEGLRAIVRGDTRPFH